jgi:conjugative relaxase-like TrwC/TraI family protein
MTVSISKMSIEYYLATTARGDGAGVPVSAPNRNKNLGMRDHDLTAYYIESATPPGRWFGSGIAALGLKADERVTRTQARLLYNDAKHPLTGESLGRSMRSSIPMPADAKTPSGAPAKSSRESVAGFDLTFSVPKSISVLWAISDGWMQEKILAAHRAAMNQSVEWLESNVVQSRAGTNGVARVPVSGLVGTCFDHWDSRDGDPQLHSHAVISNRAQRTSDGKWVTLDSYTLHRHVVAVSEQYNALLFDELYRTLGAVPEMRASLAEAMGESAPSERKRYELTGIPDALIAEFSQRSRAVDQETDRLIVQWRETHGREPDKATVLKLRQQATLATRTAKAATEEQTSLAHKMAGWRRRARAHRFDLRAVVEAAVGHEVPVITADMLPGEAVARIAEHALAQTAQRRPTFTRANLLAEAHRLTQLVRCYDPTDRHALADRIADAALEKAVSLTPTRYGPAPNQDPYFTRHGVHVFEAPEAASFTSEEMMRWEAELMSAAQSRTAPALDVEQTREALARVTVGGGHTLASDQSAAAHEVLTDARCLSAIIGPAGTGKTTTMAAIRHVWESAHGSGAVIGLAPSAVAAAVLGRELQIPTDNTAKWIYESVGEGAARRAVRYAEAQQALQQVEVELATLEDSAAGRRREAALARRAETQRTTIATCLADQAKYTLRKGQILVVDEASMSSTADLALLNGQASAAGAKILLVGDPSQLEAVEAGGFLGWMERNGHSAGLKSVWRFRNDWEADASLRLRSGDTSVLDLYEEQGRIDYCDGDARDRAYSAWLESMTAEEPRETILIAPTTEMVADLNSRAQQDMIARGRVDHARTACLRSGEAGVGDVVLARRNNRLLTDSNGDFVKNGMRLTITAVGIDGTIEGRREDTGATVSLPVSYAAESVELGYATTAHRAQGVTVEDAFCVAEAESLYRETLYVAMTRGKHTNRVFVDAPEQSDDHPDHWKMFSSIEPENGRDVLQNILSRSSATKTAHEVESAEHGWATDLGRLCAEQEYMATCISTRRLRQWVQDHRSLETVAQWQNDPLWASMVRNLPAHLPAGLPEHVSTVQELHSFIRSESGAASVERLYGLLDAPEPNSDTERELGVAVRSKIDARIRHLLSSEDDAEWRTQLTPNQRQHLPSILLWRAIASREDATTPIGPRPPKHEVRLTRLYDRISALLDIPEPQETQPARDPKTEKFIWDAWAEMTDLDPLQEASHTYSDNEFSMSQDRAAEGPAMH